MSINLQLEKMYEEDKRERLACNFENKKEVSELERTTQKRIKQLIKILPKIDETEIWNCHYVAYLFQHGETVEGFEIAHDYAKKAVEMGSKVTRWLYAATLDRWLVSQGKKQKFGTQFKLEDGNWVQGPVDESTTDEERAEYGVPPLAEQQKGFEGKYSG